MFKKGSLRPETAGLFVGDYFQRQMNPHLVSVYVSHIYMILVVFGLTVIVLNNCPGPFSCPIFSGVMVPKHL